MKRFLFSLLIFSFSAFLCPAAAGEHAATVAYGFGAFNIQSQVLKIEGKQNYDFFQVSYLYERPFRNRNVALVVEPFAAFVNRPDYGVDGGFTVGVKWYPFAPGKGLYLGPQVGAAYTSVKFQEQGTHLLFILQATIGFRFGDFFIEDRFKHYSNGSTEEPNRSVHSNLIVVGVYF